MGRLSRVEELNQFLHEMGWNPTDDELLQINKKLSEFYL